VPGEQLFLLAGRAVGGWQAGLPHMQKATSLNRLDKRSADLIHVQIVRWIILKEQFETRRHAFQL